MTKRTNALSGPQDFAPVYVQAAMRLVAKARARHPEFDMTPVKLVHVLGGDWHLVADDVVVGTGDDAQLQEAGKRLVRVIVSELNVRDRGHLLRRMETFDEPSGAEPPHFKVMLTLEGQSWYLRACAVAHGAAAAIGDMAGTLVTERVAA